MNDRLGVGILSPGEADRRDLDRRGTLPVPALERVARLDRRQRVTGLEHGSIETCRLQDRIDEPAGLGVPAGLQVCVLEIVHRVQAVERNRPGM